MKRTTWAILLPIYGLVALAIPGVGYSRPFCSAPAGGRVSAECMAQWEAAMPLFPQGFVYLLGVPMSGVVSLLALVGITLIFDLARRYRRRSSRDIARR